MKKFAMLLKDDKRMRQFVKTLVGPDCNSQKAQELVVRLGHLFNCNYCISKFNHLLMHVTNTGTKLYNWAKITLGKNNPVVYMMYMYILSVMIMF